MYTNIRLKIRDFLKKNKKIILIVLLVWGSIIAINYFIGHTEMEVTPITTYEPHTAVMDDTEVPKELQSPIENIIKEYMDACNNKEYEKAYNMLSQDCRDNLYPEIEDFKKYIDAIFNTKKIYNIQDFSNKNDTYIYIVTILNDIMLTGTTDEEYIDTYDEKIVIKNEKGELKLSIRGYIGKNKVDKMFEDDFIKIKLSDVKVDYETMTYYVEIRNKTDNTVVIQDFSSEYEIALKLTGEYRKRYGLNIDPIIINSEETLTFPLTFTRFYDEKGDIYSLIFNDIRVLKSYTGNEETRQTELNDAIKRYSVELDLK